MATHRIIWRTTAILAGLAIAITAIGLGRQAWLRTDGGPYSSQMRDAEHVRDIRVERMLALLENDPRGREDETQDAVLAVVELAGDARFESAEVHYAVGLLHHSFGDQQFAEAEAEFRRAIVMRPDWAWAHNRLAIVLYEMGRLDEAETEWATAQSLAPDWSRPYNDRAILYRRSGAFDAALAAVDKALRLDRQSPEPLFNAGVILDTMGYAEAARRYYEMAIDRDPTQAPPYFNIACGYGRRGELYPAVFYLRLAIERNPNFFTDTFFDPDLESIRYEPEFYRLLSMPYENPVVLKNFDGRLDETARRSYEHD